MSDQEKSTGMESHVLDYLYRILRIVGPIFTFAVGCVIVLTAVCLFDEFMSTMTMQVTPSQGVIADMIASILIYAIIGTVLILYSISLFFILGGDDK